MPDAETPLRQIANILQHDYKTRMLFGGCVGSKEVHCYDQRMQELLTEKFGVDIYREVYNRTVKP